jgi:subtilase family serine protease
VSPAAGSTLPPGYGPSQISQAYGFNQITFNNGTIKGDGTGQTIAIVDAYDQPNIAGDLATFDSTYGLPAPPSFTKVNQSGGTSYPATDPTWGLEISLDVEWAHAMAPGANILLVEANSSGDADLLTAVDYARRQPGVAVVSMSWGGGEWPTESLYDSYFTTVAGHSGVTFVASTGDSGSSGAPEFSSVSPNVIAVGGTALSLDKAGNYLSETGWSGSGGGISAYEAQPAYQKGVVTQSSTMRAVPDVAYNASSTSPYAVYDSSQASGWLQVYGTSAGAPQWSALIAIADQGRALNGLGALDGATQTLPLLYGLPASDYHDITSGSNGAYSAAPGYDLVTGLGTPRANLIVAALSNPSTQGPTVTTAASATPSPVTGTTTTLSVLGSDPSGASSLTYTWSVTSAPAGAATPTFSVNGSNAAQNTTATFFAAGAYSFQVTLRDPSGLTTTSSVSVTVNQTLTSIAVSPANPTVVDGTSQQFSALANDQFGNSLSTQPSFSWALAAGSVGTLSSTGLYTAPSSGNGTATVQASTGGITGSAAVTTTPPATQGPTVTTAASATPSPVTGTTTSLSALGSDPSGASSLTYTWSVTSAPAGAATPTFSVNGTNAAQNTTATFFAAGAYTFQVTLRDPSGLTTTSSVSVTVNQTLTSIAVSPGTASVADGTAQQFAAVAEDQFGANMTTQPTFTWTVVGSGSISSSASNGTYTAPSTGTGSATIQASAGSVTGAATLTYGQVPAAPTNLTARAISKNQINLTWTESSTNQTGFVIQRAPSGSNKWTTIATVGATVTAYSDTSVSRNKSYTYRVYAYNSYGNSAYSNTASATTPSVGTVGGDSSHGGGTLTSSSGLLLAANDQDAIDAAILEWFWGLSDQPR